MRGGRDVVLGSHQHHDAYLALVLEGGYEEAGDGGCVQVQPGDVVLHAAFETHMNRYSANGSHFIVLNLPQCTTITHPVMHVDDPDTIVRIAERDPHEAVARVLAGMLPVTREREDWPHALASALRCDPSLRLDAWASEARLAEATVSRGFAKVFGVTPNAYRARQKARRAWRSLLEGKRSLADVAFHSGFCDQAHMTRAVVALTGRTPGSWMRSAAGQINTRPAA